MVEKSKKEKEYLSGFQFAFELTETALFFIAGTSVAIAVGVGANEAFEIGGASGLVFINRSFIEKGLEAAKKGISRVLPNKRGTKEE